MFVDRVTIWPSYTVGYMSAMISGPMLGSLADKYVTNFHFYTSMLSTDHLNLSKFPLTVKAYVVLFSLFLFLSLKFVNINISGTGEKECAFICVEYLGYHVFASSFQTFLCCFLDES